MADNLLTNADYSKLNLALSRIQQQREALIKAQSAGLDMAQPLGILDAQQFQIEQIKKNFAPDRS